MAMTPNPTGNYIKEVTLPSGIKYEIVDEGARTQINTMSGFTTFIGVSSTTLTDGSTAASIKVGSTTINATTGAIAIYKPTDSAAQEYIWDGGKWQFFGDISAENLGALAYKNSGTYHKITAINNGSSAVTASGSFTPSGGVSLTKTTSTLVISSTSSLTNTANHWAYNPSDNLSITASAPGTSTRNFLTEVTGRTVLSSLATADPTTASVTGGVNYTSVNDHNLNLCYIVSSSANAISASSSAAAVTAVSAPTINKSGTTQYVKPLTVTVATAASFSGTAATVTVNSGTNKFLTSVTATSANTAVTFS